MFCTNCGKENDAAAHFCQACGVGLSPPAAGTASAKVIRNYAGFWRRFLAVIIDSIIVGAATGLVTAGTFGAGWISIFFLPWLYEAAMLSSEKQATVGKMVMDMIVTDVNGGRLSFSQATIRHFAKWLSGLSLGIGFIMAAFTEKKQALHDLIASTLVVET